MPYVQQGSLVRLFDADSSPVVARAIAGAGGERLHENVVRNTPIDTGNLRTSWYRVPPVGSTRTNYGGFRAYHVRVATDVGYAPFVEEGTGIWGPKGSYYTILPVNGTVLSWIDPRTGERVARRRVRHPGSPGQHMMGIAAALTEHQIDEIAQPLLSAWAARLEAAGSA